MFKKLNKDFLSTLYIYYEGISANLLIYVKIDKFHAILNEMSVNICHGGEHDGQKIKLKHSKSAREIV